MKHWRQPKFSSLVILAEWRVAGLAAGSRTYPVKQLRPKQEAFAYATKDVMTA